jgi:hypothetical protein
MRGAVLALLAVGFAARASAQDLVVGDPREDYVRVLQLLGKAHPGPLLLRPITGGMLARVDSTGHPWAGRLVGRSGAIGRLRFGLADPEVRGYVNSTRPLADNDGLVWQGKGATLYATAGVWGTLGPVTVTLQPEYAWAQNRAFATLPVTSDSPSPFADPWYGRGLDRPQRFGDGGYEQWSLGQSSVRVDLRGFAAGVTSANAWWGPGQRQAILLSNQPPGFPRAFLATGRPVDVGFGRVEFHWFWGALAESRFFDLVDTNDTKYVTGLAFDLEIDPVPGLYLGGARLFYLDWPTTGLDGGELFLVFQGVTKVSQETPENPTGDDDRDQMLSLFARWVLPASGFEVNAEWARNDHSGTVRDFLLQPEHSQGYTVGMQKAWDMTGRSILRARAELTHLELSKTVLARPTPTYYVHYRVHGGYTHRGQVVGAVVGPGGNGQYAGLDWFARWGTLGGFVVRHVKDNDTYYRLVRAGTIPNWPPRNDVELTVGATGSVFLGRVTVGGTLAVGREWNRYYEELNDQTNLHAEVRVRWTGGIR